MTCTTTEVPWAGAVLVGDEGAMTESLEATLAFAEELGTDSFANSIRNLAQMPRQSDGTLRTDLRTIIGADFGDSTGHSYGWAFQRLNDDGTWSTWMNGALVYFERTGDWSSHS